MKKLLLLATNTVAIIPLVTMISCFLSRGGSGDAKKPKPSKGQSENTTNSNSINGDLDKVSVISKKPIITMLPTIELDFRTLKYENLVNYALNIDKIPKFDKDDKKIEESAISIANRKKDMCSFRICKWRTEAEHFDTRQNIRFKIFKPSKNAIGNYKRKAKKDWIEHKKPILNIVGSDINLKTRINWCHNDELKDHYKKALNVKEDFSLTISDRYVAQWFYLTQLQIVSEFLYNYAYFKIGLIDVNESSKTSLKDYYKKNKNATNLANFEKIASKKRKL